VALLPDLVAETRAEGIYAHSDCERIYGRVRDARLNRALAQRGMKIRWFDPAASVDHLLPYPQYRDLWYEAMGEVLVPTPQRVNVPPEIASEALPDLTQLGHIGDDKPLPDGSTAAARKLLQDFLADKSDRYYWQLSYPSAEATTGLSPHIKFGVISVRECVQTIRRASDFGDHRRRRSHQQLISRLRWGCGFTQRFRYLPQLELRSLYQVFDEEGWPFDPAPLHGMADRANGFPHCGCGGSLSGGDRGLPGPKLSQPCYLCQLFRQPVGHGLALRSPALYAPFNRRRLPHRSLPVGHAIGGDPLPRQNLDKHL
jgi:deoxyribodipyrimidine photo-lyase